MFLSFLKAEVVQIAVLQVVTLFRFMVAPNFSHYHAASIYRVEVSSVRTEDAVILYRQL
jgi:hypothetical protein